MAHIQYVDELVREYLLYRGFTSSLKAFDNELKTDKEKGFRVDKIVDQLILFVYNYDLNSLRDLWGHLETRIFSKLEHNLANNVRKLENAVLKFYLINASINNKIDKIHEFFKIMTSEIQNQSEWKEWFIFPFVKVPEENPTFTVYFTKQWQDTLLISLHNFLATVFQCMPQPILTNFEEDASRLKRLQEENDQLRGRLNQLMDQMSRNSGAVPGTSVSSANETVVPFDVTPPPHIFDDFYIIAQENNTAENQVKGLKSIIRNMGTSSSPTMSRKDISNTKKKLSTSKSWKPS